MKSLRFLMLNWRDTENPLAGGAERVTLRHMAELVRRGHEVVWFANHFDGAERETTIDGIQIIRGGGRRMGSHLYNSRLGKVAWFVRRFGAAELFLKPLRCAFAPLIIPCLARAEFVFEDKSLPLFYHRYNMTWATERAVEVPIAQEFIERFAGKRVLEVGNVTPHYLDTAHTVLDKYERGPGIINEDIADYSPTERFDLILSVSTFEHIGYDDEANGESGEKISQAITICRGLLTAGGQLVLTLPLGYNPALDRMIADGQLGCDRAIFLKRTGRLAWQTVDAGAALACEYGRPFPYGNAVMIAQFGGLPE